MDIRKLASLPMWAALVAGVCAGCESLPAGQGMTFSGIGGRLAAAGMTAGDAPRPVSLLIGGSLGFGGGYLVGVSPDKLDEPSRPAHREAALRANDRAERSPADAEDVAGAATADVNADGFVTVDEIVAMEGAALSDDEEIARLRATGHLFELSPQQERYLEDRGVSLGVVKEIRRMNGDPAAPGAAVAANPAGGAPQSLGVSDSAN
jgi:hypothetical protein